jgi:glycogen debranching enzyme
MDHQSEPIRETITGPRGDEFELVGRARPIKLRRPPRIAAEAGGELLVVKADALFVCSRPDGDMYHEELTGTGFYEHDTRFLSEMRLMIGGRRPVLLSSSAELAYEAFINLTNPTITGDDGAELPQMSLDILRTRLVSDRLYERFELRNHSTSFAETTLELLVGADFADMFEVRGVRYRRTRGHELAAKRVDGAIRFAYLGEDKEFRETLIEFDPHPAEIEMGDVRATVRWPIHLPPRQSVVITLAVAPSLEEPPPPRRVFETAESGVSSSAQTWSDSCSRIESQHQFFDRVVAKSVRDLWALRTSADGHDILAAGIPWFVAPFGRDTLLSCYESLLLNPSPAKDALLFLAARQATDDEPERDAEPGKILHELRSGELARAGYVPHTPYYGSVDATPLFLMLAAAYYRWTGDIETMERLTPSFDAALQWIDLYGDRDGDGFVEYERRSSAGLNNQGWKDSDDAVLYPDGSRAEGPIALVEVQGYVYMAKERVSQVYDSLGLHDVAEGLRKEAAELREAFDHAFWMPDEGTYALALDGSKKQVKSVTSNPGHCLYCDIIEPDKATAVIERLMAPDMFSGWGVRTLSSEHAAYNPLSYHNGSVWPHDNAIIAAGFKRFHAAEATEAIATALFEAAVETDSRLPELYCGFTRQSDAPLVSYPVACKPQAWAAAAPFMILQSLLGISARAPENLLTVNQPRLPSWLSHVELHGIKIGDSQISLSFGRDQDATSVSLLSRDGDVRVTIQE